MLCKPCLKIINFCNALVISRWCWHSLFYMQNIKKWGSKSILEIFVWLSVQTCSLHCFNCFILYQEYVRVCVWDIVSPVSESCHLCVYRRSPLLHAGVGEHLHPCQHSGVGVLPDTDQRTTIVSRTHLCSSCSHTLILKTAGFYSRHPPCYGQLGCNIYIDTLSHTHA